MASFALEIWLGINSGGMVVMLGCSQVWLATSIPASRMRLAPAGLAATLLPIRKNVDLASLSCRIFSSRSVYGLGPSSNVNATHLTCEQSTLSAPALRTWPVSPPTTSTVAAASTPNTVRQYLQAWLSGRFGTLAAYRVGDLRRATGAQRGRGSANRSGEGAGADLFEHLGDQRRDRRALAAQQRDVSEQRVALELLDHRRHAVVAADPQVVPLSDIVGKHHPRPGAQSRQHGQQHVAFQRLRLVDDHERIVQGASADVCQRQHLEHAARQHFFEYRRAGQAFERVEDGLRPWAHLFALAARQVAEVLAADRIQRPEHDDLAMCAAFQHGLQPSAQRKRRLAGARFTAERHDADRLVLQQIQRHPLLRRAAAQPEHLAIAAHELHPLLGVDPPQRVRGSAEQPNAGVAREITR